MMQEVVPVKKDVSFYIHIVITIAIMLVVSNLPPVAPLTRFGMQMLGIFVGMLYGWTFSNIIWTSLFGIIAMGLSEGTTFANVVLNGFGSEITLLVLMSCLFVAAIEKCQLSRYIALWMLSRKVLGGRPWLFSAVIFIVSFLLGALVTPIAGVLLCSLVVYDVCKQVGFVQGDGYPTVMIIGIFFVGILGYGAIPWGIVPLIVFGSFAQMTGEALNFLTYILYYWPVTFLLLALYTLMCKFLFRVNVRPMLELDTDALFKDFDKTMTKQQRVVFVVFICYIITMLAPNILPKAWALTQLLKTIGVCGIVFFYVILLQWIKVDGQTLINFQKDAVHIQWEAVILTAAVMPLSSLLTAKETGVTAFLVAHLGQMLSGKSAFVFAALIFVLATVITNFCNNAVTGVLLLPIICNFAPIVGIAPITLAIPLLMCLHLAMMTPAACPISAILHGNRVWVKVSDIYKYGGAAMIMSVIVIATVGLAWVSWLL